MQIQVSSAPPRRRRMALGLLAESRLDQITTAKASLDKWKVYRAVCAAKPRLDLSDRALAVLSALLSFYPDVQLSHGSSLTVFPSNRQLASRAHGMAEATIRRHLASLVEAGLIIRKDSPNGKRYARRNAAGEIQRAFGFSLSPLLTRFEEFERLATELAEQRNRTSLLREAISIHRRDIQDLVDHAAQASLQLPASVVTALTVLQERAPRSIGIEPLAQLEQTLRILKDDLLNLLKSMENSGNLSGKASQNERHIESPKPDIIPESETSHVLETPHHEQIPARSGPTLTEILKACPEITPYGPNGKIQSLTDLSKAAFFVRQMLRITDSTYHEAVNTMGQDWASLVIACMLERAAEISHPDAYFRDLIDKTRRKAFSPSPMFRSLMRTRSAADNVRQDRRQTYGT